MKIINTIKKYIIPIYCLILSFAFLLFTSKNSFLYPLNDWVDANAFFTVGKSMMHGVVPYKDLFEQKGILLYFIYGLGSLISFKNFYGIFVIEVLLFSLFLYYIHKIITLFIKKEYSYLILPVISLLITTSTAFVHGSSCEEFCLPLFAISLYYYLRHFKEKELNYKELALNGFLAGCILLIKYTLLGFWFAFMMFIFFNLFFKKQYKKAFLSCLAFLGGMFIPLLIALIYFAINKGIKEFFDVYFLFNINAYNNEKSTLIIKLKEIFTGFVKAVNDNGLIITILILGIPLFITQLKTNTYCKITLILTFIITIIGMFWGLRFYRYYLLPIFIILTISLVSLISILSKYTDSFFKWRYYLIPIILINIVLIICSYYNANYREMIGLKKNEMFQYRYAKYINQYENPTLLNMGYLDGGLYTTTGIIPNTRYFELQNISYKRWPENKDSFKKYVENEEITFILYYTKKDIDYVKEKDSYIFDHYHLVFNDQQLFENKTYNAYLFELNNLQ